MASGGAHRGSTLHSRDEHASLTEFPKADSNLQLLTVEPGQDVISAISEFFKNFGALYTEKASGSVSCATLENPDSNTVRSLSGGSYRIVNLYGPLQGDTSIERGLWVLLGTEAGEVLWGRAVKPLTADTPVKVWLLR